MAPVRIALATRCLKLPLRESLRAAAAAGATGVQFDARDELKPGDLTETGRRQFVHHLEELGLAAASLTFPTRRALYDQERLDARVGALRDAMQFAWQLGCRVLTVRAGKIPADKDSAPYKLLVEVLEDLARHGNRVGVTLAVSPSHDSPPALAELLERVKTGPVGIDFDPAAFVLAGHSPGESFRTLHATVAHVQARDAVGNADAGGVEVPLGRGEVDWLELLPLLDEIRYSGWITAIRTQGDDQPGDVARAVTFLKNVGL